jgi:hypothetical protein
MSKKIFSGVLLIFSLVFVSCENEPLEPELLSTTENSFFCKINGVDFIPEVVNGTPNAGAEVALVQGTIGNIVENLGIFIPNSLSPGEYQLSQLPSVSEISVQYFSPAVTGSESFVGEGTVTIITNSSTNISGTFEFVVRSFIDQNSPVLNVTEGSFNLSF